MLSNSAGVDFNTGASGVCSGCAKVKLEFIGTLIKPANLGLAEFKSALSFFN